MNSASQTPHHRNNDDDDDDADGIDADDDKPGASAESDCDDEFRPTDAPGCLAAAADDNDGDIPRVILPWDGRRLLSGEPVTEPARWDSPNLYCVCWRVTCR